MQLTSFDDFLKGLHDEIVRLEFSHYDFQNQVRSLSGHLAMQFFCIAQTACIAVNCNYQVRSLWRYLANLPVTISWGSAWKLRALQAWNCASRSRRVSEYHESCGYATLTMQTILLY